MSRETFNAEARRIQAQAQADCAAAQRALLAEHQARLRDALNQIAQSAARNGVSVRPQGFVLPNVTQVLSMARPNQVLNISW